MKSYAGIGSRETPDEICLLMTKIARHLKEKGYFLRSGGAEGADQAFEKGAGSKAEIWLPKKELPLWTSVFTDYFHPAPNRLKEYPRQLMNRNAMQILGEFGSNPVNFVVCWTPDGKDSGGTGQAIRIAQYYSIPVYNLYWDETQIKMEEKIEKPE